MKRIFSFVFIIVTINSFAQLLPIRTYFTDEGLASSQVWSITEDKEGYLWFGCSSGLSKFNGFKFTTHRTKNGLPSGGIEHLICKNGIVLAATVKGIAYKKENFENFTPLPDIGEIKSADIIILPLSGENIAASVKNKGIFLYNLKRQEWQKLDLKQSNIDKLCEFNGAILFSDTKGNLFKLNPSNKAVKKIGKTNPVVKMKKTLKNEVLIICEDRVYLYKSGNLSPVYLLKNRRGTIFDASIDIHSDTVWVATSFGLIKSVKGKETLYSTVNGLPGRRILSVFINSKGILWFGTNHGVCKLVAENMLVFKNPESTSPISYFCFYTGENKKEMLFGTSIGIFKPRGEKLVRFKLKYLEKAPVWDMVKDKEGNFYIASEGKGLIVIDKKGKEKVFSTQNSPLPGNNVTDLLVENNKVYVATKSGFAFYSNGKIYPIAQDLPVSYVRCVEKYKNNTFLLATLGGGIFVFDGKKTKSFLKKTPRELKSVYHIYFDKKRNAVWAATNYGLAKIKNGKVKIYSTESGFLPLGLTAIFPVKNYLWIGSDGGAILFDPLKEKVIKVLTIDDGLPGSEFTIHNAIAKDSENNIWFGVFGGGARIKNLGLTSTEEQRFEPKIIFKSLQYYYRNKIHTITNAQKNHIVIPYEAREIFIYLDIIWFANEYSLKLEYKLSGINNMWNKIEDLKNIKIYYTSLNPGTFPLKIRVSALSKNKKIIRKILKITVTTPWWKKKEYIISLIILGLSLFALLTYGYGYAKTKRMQKEKEKLDKMVKERTKQLNTLNIKLEEKNKILKELAEKDYLTGLYNRRFFINQLNAIKNIAEREKEFFLCVIIFDIDNFKVINDIYGHVTGDKVLKKIAEKIKEKLQRKSDIAARYGGEEFIIALPRTSTEKALSLAEDIRKTIEETKIQADKGSFSVTVSGGVCCANISDKNITLEHLIKTADEKLYIAKRTGKNKIIN